MMLNKQLIDYLNQHKPISEADCAIINGAFERKSYKEGAVLAEGGRISKNMFFIQQGILKIIKYDEDAKPVTYFLVNENHFCTVLYSFLNQVPSGEEIQAASEVDVLVITKSKLAALYQQLPYFEALINHITQTTLMEKIKLRNAYLGKDAAARYQYFLQQQADVAHRVSLSDIASYLGITQQSLSRIRRQIL